MWQLSTGTNVFIRLTTSSVGSHLRHQWSSCVAPRIYTLKGGPRGIANRTTPVAEQTPWGAKAFAFFDDWNRGGYRKSFKLGGKDHVPGQDIYFLRMQSDIFSPKLMTLSG